MPNWTYAWLMNSLGDAIGWAATAVTATIAIRTRVELNNMRRGRR